MRGLLFVVLAGCSTDVCAPFDGQTCVGLELHGDPSLFVDRVGVAIDGVLAEQLSPTGGPHQPPLQLPLALAVLTGDPANDLILRVRTFLGGAAQAQAVSRPLTLMPGEHLAAVLDLVPLSGDLGADLRGIDLAPGPSAPPDLAGNSFDLAGADMDSFADLFSPSDLAGAAPDLPFSSADLFQFCQGVTVSTLAGDGSFDFLDGAGSIARFNSPAGMSVDVAGNLYVADFNNNRIRKLAPDGTTSTLAGDGSRHFADGTGGPTGTAEFSAPTAVAVDGSGNVFVADDGNNSVRKVASDGTTTTLSGNGGFGSVDGTGGRAGTTELNAPYGIAVDALGFVYVSESNGAHIRKLASDGSSSTLAGNGTSGFFDGTGGAGGSTEFNFPVGLAVDPGGNVVVADFSNNRIRLVAPSGSTTTLAGNGLQGTTDGSGGPFGETRFANPNSVVRAADGNIYVADQANSRIRRVAPDGTTLTVAGSIGGGFQNGSGCIAQFNAPQGITAFGNLIYVADTTNSRIRVIQLP